MWQHTLLVAKTSRAPVNLNQHSSQLDVESSQAAQALFAFPEVDSPLQA